MDKFPFSSSDNLLHSFYYKYIREKENLYYWFGYYIDSDIDIIILSILQKHISQIMEMFGHENKMINVLLCWLILVNMVWTEVALRVTWHFIDA